MVDSTQLVGFGRRPGDQGPKVALDFRDAGVELGVCDAVLPGRVVETAVYVVETAIMVVLK